MPDDRTPRRLVPGLLSVLGALGAIALVAGGIMLDRSYAQARGQALDGAQRSARTQAAALDTVMAIPPSQVRFVAGHAQTRRALAARQRDARSLSTILGRARRIDSDLTGLISVIDATGTERVRQQGDRILPGGSRSVAASTWFAPTLASTAGAVHRDPPQVSLESRIWILSTSAAVRQGAQALGVVQLETPLEALRRRWTAGLPAGAEARAVDPRTGTVVLDSTRPTPLPGPADDLITQWLPRDRPMTGSVAEDLERVGSATTGAGWRVDVLAAPVAVPDQGRTLITAGILLGLAVAVITLARKAFHAEPVRASLPRPRPASEATTAAAEQDQHAQRQTTDTEEGEQGRPEEPGEQGALVSDGTRSLTGG